MSRLLQLNATFILLLMILDNNFSSHDYKAYSYVAHLTAAIKPLQVGLLTKPIHTEMARLSQPGLLTE